MTKRFGLMGKAEALPAFPVFRNEALRSKRAGVEFLKRDKRKGSASPDLATGNEALRRLRAPDDEALPFEKTISSEAL